MDAQTQSSNLDLKILEWLYAHKKQLIIGVSSVAAIAAIWGFVVWHKASTEADANAALFAVPIGGGPRSAPVSPQKLLEVANTYPGAPSGEYAQLLAAEALFNAGKYPEAGQQFSEFLGLHPDSPLVPQAKVGVAAALEAQGKTAEAINKYHDIIVMYPSELSIVSPAKLTLARLYEQDGKPDLAFNSYAELARMLTQNPYDPWASEARERAQLLVAKYPELLKSQAAPAPGAAPGGLSVPETPGAPAAPSGQPTPSGSPTPKLLTIPGATSNATTKP